MADTAKRLAPTSWAGVTVWAVLLVVFATNPVEAPKFLGSAVIGAGRWVGYTAFADCDDTPPYGWMAPKDCPAEPDPTLETEAGRP